VNVFDDFPQNEGMPQSLEAQHIFYITRNEDLPHPHSEIPTTYTSQPGLYQLHFRMPPDRYTQPGNYSVYSTAVSSPILRGSASTSFILNSYVSPPQAAFTYTPLEVYANMTVTFDGSSSSAEGFNDVITSYEWMIGDIPPVHVPPNSNPTTQHAFVNSGTYIVELNVTDSEGLWSTTSKPITILPEYDPTADFTWLPPTPNMNQSVTFNASSSTPGWSAQIPGYAPIVTYRWDFDDGTPVQNTGNPIISHTFTQPGNFTVELTVTDSVGRTGFTFRTVQVLNETYRIYDLDRNYVIDMRDVAIAARAFGTSPGDPLWNPDADITGPGDVPDGKVDMRDIALVATHFGETY
jgi:PKD repeat protein